MNNRTTMTDDEGSDLGEDLARIDLSCGRPAATEDSILEALEAFGGDGQEIGGWAQAAAVRGYRRAYAG